jgi:hypothetical protein
MKTFSHSDAAVNQRSFERLGNIVGMDVVHRFEPEVWQNYFFATRQAAENLGIEMAHGIKRFPTRPDDVPGVQQGGWKSSEAGFPQEVFFNCGLLHTVLAERPARCLFGGRHLNAGAMDPDRSAMEKMLDLTAERFNQLLRAFRRKANQVNQRVRPQRANAFPKSPTIFFLRAIKLKPRYELPSAIQRVRFAPASAKSDDLVPGSDQPRDQVCSNMSGTTNDDDAHRVLIFANIAASSQEARMLSSQ